MAILQRTVQNISVDQPQATVGQVLVSTKTINDKFYSSPILNYVEPIEVGGVLKTVFFTEISTKINVGERVFISNGNYDSNEYIRNNKYARFTDGYRVLAINGCRIVLDIDYTGALPYLDPKLNNIIIIHHIESQNEFDYINSIRLPISNLLRSPYWGEIVSDRLQLRFQSLIYVDKSFAGSSNFKNLNGGVIDKGFYIRSDDDTTNRWTPVNDQIFSNNIFLAGASDNNHGIFIDGGSFEYGGLSFDTGYIYKFENFTWKTDIRYKKSYLSKSVFRFGNFKGTHNDGVFGSYDRRSIWNNAIWKSGSLMNARWVRGLLDSKNTNDEVMSNCRLDKSPTTTTVTPVESIDANGNRGFGYNYSEDSIFETYSISKGNFHNDKFLTQSLIKSSLDIFYNVSTSHINVINGGKFELCEINDTRINNAYLLNNHISNTNIVGSKLVSCETTNSSLSKSFWSSDGGIRIISADLWSFETVLTTPINISTTTIGTIKLYISEIDYLKLNQGDVFYISELNKRPIFNLLNDKQKILHFLETRFMIDSYVDWDIVPGQQTNIHVSLSSTLENKISYYASESSNPNFGSINIFENNTVNLPSINISSEIFAFYKSLSGTYIPSTNNKISPIAKSNINTILKDTILRNGEFKSGIFSESTWLSGDNINYSNNLLTKIQTNGKYNISVKTQGNLKILSIILTKNRFNSNYIYDGYDFKPGDYVWIKSIIQDSDKKILFGKFKVNRYIETSGELLLEDVFSVREPNEVRIQELDQNSSFGLEEGLSNNYLSIYKFNITKSTIQSGKFLKTGIDNTTFFNEQFKKYEDPISNLPNTNILRVVNTMLQFTNNTFRSGILLNSHFYSKATEVFDGGTFYDSIWLRGEFKDGLFKNSVWKTGTFSGGKFSDNRNTILTTFNYDSSSDYRLWQGGVFSGGEFYNSLWSKGDFTGGRFYFSDWTGGNWYDGVLGSKNFRTKDTNMGVKKSIFTWGDTSTKWYNGVVENATIGGEGIVDWYGGKMLGGDFTSLGRSSDNYTTWHDGEFFGSSFTGEAWWKNGKFFSGKFLSTIGWTQSNFLVQSTNIKDWSWVDGEFYGGEFGNAELDANSTWYNGTMEGGVFKGKVWRDGIFTNGKFYGSFVYESDVNEKLFYFGSDTNFYGLWLNGHVNPLISNIKTDRLIKDTDLTTSTKNVKRVLKIVDMYNVVWKSGTFSHELSTFNDSVWLDGEFNKGYFNDSFFNPYVDLALSGIPESSTYLQKIITEVKDILNIYQSIFGSNTTYGVDPDLPNITIGSSFYYANDPNWPSFYQLYSQVILELFSYIDNPAYDFTVVGEYFSSTDAEYIDGSIFPLQEDDIRNTQYITGPNESIILKFYSKYLNSISTIPENEALYVVFNFDLEPQQGQQYFGLKFIYPNYAKAVTATPYSFNKSSTCVWKNGVFDGREFNYSIWYDGTFQDGVFTGGIWKKGIFNYGKMINTHWENGVWINGTWDGTPFGKSNLITSPRTNNYKISDNKTQQIITRIIDYTNNYNLHLLNVYVLSGNPSIVQTFSLGSVFEIDEGLSFPVAQGSPNWKPETSITDQFGTVIRDVYVTSGLMSSYKMVIGQKVFADYKLGYKIEIKLSSDIFGSVRSTFTLQDEIGRYVLVEFKIGPLPLVTKKVYLNGTYDEIKTFYFYYHPTDFDLRTQPQDVWIRKISPGVIKLIDTSIISGVYVYSDELNNKIYDSSIYSLYNETEIPLLEPTSANPLQIYVGDTNGNTGGIKFGNGKFLSGLWKTGVWNNGWRGPWNFDALGNILSDDLYYFDSINNSTFKLNENLWYLKIDSNTNTENFNNIIQNISENDFISLSNVVGIDLNEERYLLKDYYKVTSVQTNVFTVTLTIEIPVSKFPLRRFEIDSTNHLIYVTKNIWLGGTFLNGYFRGIWNYGLFKGFPYTTLMDNSHFVSGKFDGGRFISREKEILSSNLELKKYNSGLVQFFEFFDNNISENYPNPNYIDNTYRSWMDVVYYNTSYVNLNSLTSIYDDNFGKLVPLPNLYGYPTLDVLSSYSKFKNTGDSDVDFYRLGTKYNIYTDYLEDKGYFRKAFNSEGKPGLKDFSEAGWRVDVGPFYGTPTVSFIYNSNITRRNFNKISMILATFGYNVLNNVNISIPDKRYSIVEYDLEYFQRGIDPNTNQFTNTFSKPLNLLGSNYSSINNVYKSGIVKTEYFYNKNALDLILRYNSEYQPPRESLAMFGYNVTHSTSPYTVQQVAGPPTSLSGTAGRMISNSGGVYLGEARLPNLGQLDVLQYWPTTYSLVFLASASQYINSVSNPESIETYDANKTYKKYDVVRRPSTDAFGHFFISLQDNNLGEDLPGLYSYESPWWVRQTIGFNDQFKELGILDQGDIFDYFTSVRIKYFKYLEVDALPFFNYFDFEINFFTTAVSANGSSLNLEFLKPHGLKVGDYITISLDERKYNPQYEGLAKIDGISDFPLKNGNIEYIVTTDVPFGNTVSYLGESGTVAKAGNRIDSRIQSNYYKEAPKVEGLDETFIYLGNNQIVVDRDQF